MFDNILSPSPGVWAGLIAGMIALPILIHLINLMRHKSVKWAAMDFLLKSHKKNRNRIWLKQMMLLLSRIAALLLVLFMLGQVGCNEDRIARLLGGATTHHYVIIDDSFSMSDRASDGSAMDNARATLSLIATRAKNRQNQKFTILRSSRAAGMSAEAESETETQLASVADMNSQLVDNLFEGRIEAVKASLQPSNLATGIDDALQTVSTLVSRRENSNAIVYVLSDFRQKDWLNPVGTAELLKQIRDEGAAIELINCVTSSHKNLAITSLTVNDSVRVPRTPMMMNVTVKNCSDEIATNVQVRIQSLSFPDPGQSGDVASIDPEIDDLPTVFIEKIEPGQSRTRPFAISFNTTGQHSIIAALDDDPVTVDNTARVIVPVKTAARVLMIEAPEGNQADFLSLAIAPGGLTGIAPEVRTKDFLRDTSPERLSEFDVVYLLDVDRLDETAIRNLESYAQSGGGVAFFSGPNLNLSFYNSQLYRNGEGIFPVLLDGRFDVPEMIADRVPDIAPKTHPVFPQSLQNAVLNAVQISSMLRVSSEWIPENHPNTTLAATLRGQDSHPLIVQSRFGNGNVMAVLTTAGTSWNNWARNGTFPAVMLLAEDMLARGRYQERKDLVGDPLSFTVPTSEFGPEATFVLPSKSDDPAARIAVTQRMTIENESGDAYLTVLGGRTAVTGGSSAGDVQSPGIYDIWLQRGGTPECRRFALNVDTSESEMDRVPSGALLTALQDSSPSFVAWNQFNPEPERQSASSLSRLLLILLVLILIGEQILAWSCSYHARPSSAQQEKNRGRTAGRRGLAA